MANIMIVDDSPIIRQSLRNILEELGHRVVREAANGKEALAFYKETEIDLVTMDIEMPGINGIEVVRLLREQDLQANIVMISSIEDRSRVLEAIKLGARHYFVKPFSADKVREVVVSVLGTKPKPEQVTGKKQVESVSKFQTSNPNRLAGEREASPSKVPDLDTLPFELFHMDERTILIIRHPITDGNVQTLKACLQGLLYFRKMKFVVEFWEPVQHEEGYRVMLDFIISVRNRKGKAAVVTEDAGYYAQMLSKLREDVYRMYKEIKW